MGTGVIGVNGKMCFEASGSKIPEVMAMLDFLGYMGTVVPLLPVVFTREYVG